jgi:hypothetical protein
MQVNIISPDRPIGDRSKFTGCGAQVNLTVMPVNLFGPNWYSGVRVEAVRSSCEAPEFWCMMLTDRLVRDYGSVETISVLNTTESPRVTGVIPMPKEADEDSFLRGITRRLVLLLASQ